MKKCLMFSFITVLLLFGCSTSESTQIDLSQYNFLDYLPSEEGSFREYITYGTEKEGGTISRYFLNDVTQEKLSEEITVNNYDYDYSVFFSDASSELIEQKRLITANDYRIIEYGSLNKNVILSKELKWKDDEFEYEITDVGIDVSSKVGEFSNCIEIVKKSTYEKMKEIQKEYHCPKVGEVISYSKVSDSDDFILNSELIYVSIPGERELGEQYLIDTILTEESSSVEENPLATLVSGGLPKQTGKVSNLTFSDYQDRVNAYSLESIGYYILHNPINFVENESNILLEFDEGITVLIENDTYLVKEIAVKHDYINETSYIYANDLIMGIDPSITTDQAHDILHPEVEGTIGEVLDFSIGQDLENGHFSFLAVVK